MKLFVRIMIGVGLVVAFGAVTITIMFGPISRNRAVELIQIDLESFALETDNPNVVMRLYAPDKGLDLAWGAGATDPDHRFHAASVGKTFTAALLHILAEQGLLDLDVSIATYLDPEITQGLFVINDHDHSREVTSRMLMDHSAGINDYFEGDVIQGKPFLTEVLQNPDHLWSPHQLLEFTRNRQNTLALPGETFAYSDSGYILLGRIVEAVTGMTFEAALAEHIFEPLGLSNTDMDWGVKDQLLPIQIGEQDFRQGNLLSIDWSGGGIITNTQDLITFMHALHSGSLVSGTALAQMTDFSSQFDKGIWYGEGMMQFRLGELSPLLSSFGTLYGGVGTSGSYILTNADQNLFIAMNVGRDNDREAAMREIINILVTLNRISDT